MSREVFSCRPQDDLSTAQEAMRDYRVRRLPVTDANGTLKGILSLNDIVRRASNDARSKSKKIGVSHSDVAHTLGEISVPHARTQAARAS